MTKKGSYGSSCVREWTSPGFLPSRTKKLVARNFRRSTRDFCFVFLFYLSARSVGLFQAFASDDRGSELRYTVNFFTKALSFTITNHRAYKNPMSETDSRKLAIARLGFSIEPILAAASQKNGFYVAVSGPSPWNQSMVLSEFLVSSK